MDVRPSTKVVAITRRRGLAALSALVLVSCAGRRRGGDVRLKAARRPAAGRPAGCPEDAVDPFGDGRPGPMDLRCSYEDAPGGQAIQLSGAVHSAPRPGGTLGDALQHVTVHIHDTRPDGTVGAIVAEATTDAQGGFSIAVMLPAGEYLLVLPAVVPGPPQATRRFALAGNERTVGDLNLLVPAAP